MHQIISKQTLAPSIKQIIVQAPLVARKASPGQFVVLIIDEKGERIPLTIVDKDKDQGTITLIFQEVGKTTLKLGQLQVGDVILGLLGPLGKATEIRKLEKVITVGGGVGIAEVLPVTRAFQEAGSSIISIIGARTKDLLILEQRMQQASDKLFITTDDGSSGRRGFVSDVLKEIVSKEKVDLVYAVGPVPMMRSVAEITRAQQIKTMVSLNPVMVDATGMCASCRINLQGVTQFACVDGPEFDAHLVDFVELEKRLNLFSEQEEIAR